MANLELTDSIIGVRAGLQGATEKTVAQIAKYLKDGGYIEDYDQTGLKTITGMSFGSVETEGIVLGVETTSEEITASFSSTNPSEDYYVQISGKKYPITKTNGRIKITPTEITLGTQPKGEITSVEVNSTGTSVGTTVASATVEGDDNNAVQITGIAKGTANVIAKYTNDIYATIPVIVKGNVSITTRSANTSVGTATTITPTSYAEGSQISLTAEVTNQDYQFDGWYESIDSGTATQKSTSLSYTYTVPDNATSVVVETRFSEKPAILGTTANDSGIGYYIKKGNEYAIVFADRITQAGETVVWSVNNNSSCTFPELTGNENFKTYVISDEEYSGHKVLKIADGDNGTEDRFFAMSLTDFGGSWSYYTWYYSEQMANNHMYDLEPNGGTDGKGSPISKAFLSGKTNTATMIDRWNKKIYGEQDALAGYLDLWGQVQTKYQEGWFVPSFEEWVAFGYAKKEKLINSQNLELKDDGYWSSSVCDSYNGIYYASGISSNYNPIMGVNYWGIYKSSTNPPHKCGLARLATTFQFCENLDIDMSLKLGNLKFEESYLYGITKNNTNKV